MTTVLEIETGHRKRSATNPCGLLGLVGCRYSPQLTTLKGDLE